MKCNARPCTECHGNSVRAGDHAATADQFFSDVTPLLMGERAMMICEVQDHRSFLM